MLIALYGDDLPALVYWHKAGEACYSGGGLWCWCLQIAGKCHKADLLHWAHCHMTFACSQDGKLKILPMDDTLLHASSNWIPQRERGRQSLLCFTKGEVWLQGGYIICSKSPSWQVFMSKIFNSLDSGLSAWWSYFSSWEMVACDCG